MENAGYTTLTRQSGLAREMQIVANNIANTATTGFRAEGLIFSEFVQPLERGASLSMGQGNVKNTSFAQGALTKTGGTFDLAIEGDGYFLVETPGGERLTRAGAFSPSAEGDLVTPDGYRVLDAGGAPIFVPSGVIIAVSGDGTLSADGTPLGQIGIVRPSDAAQMTREDGVMFDSPSGFEPAETARVLQGFVENSNVNAVSQLARMIEVQRAYELGQSFLETEDERVRAALKSLSS
ncbi:flagellar hook-basal body complex protein [Sulfitobacter mediterraneus]|uniref:flagellar hook-basal body complex protein n=1 Tax=Sulfitobacter mediterraneus TaxID=83219 RepID=UPI0019316D87|nr:flagellar hook-basal body complex protein [Sulfitobacter mediterraneus]MBM1308777.1 flagellar hook-basal body complex protein [Sulfitobacter mediterraneus]MBM1312662.1 flagellar hook-basal body complex protein [Sulfitobacter mediterraneus]MBM1321044.1 flagellar hook-basal body complex protein [Sulfitobacter mediterraneus]MBM1324931.1 flagellar hook-basal body complex protein [Sulfitobacter mediterraneus]MBM1396278.1 flagellar hook-basal body complex protein [Sulfitobacter mediterraneus]